MITGEGTKTETVCDRENEDCLPLEAVVSCCRDTTGGKLSSRRGWGGGEGEGSVGSGFTPSPGPRAPAVGYTSFCLQHTLMQAHVAVSTLSESHQELEDCGEAQ